MDRPLPLGSADLHVHPSGDAGTRRAAAAAFAALRATDLQVAVLADHDRIDIARELVARATDDPLPVRLVVGQEVSTRGGHLLGIGLTARVPAWMSLAEAVVAIHEQGGLAVVAHPLLPSRVAATARELIALAERDDPSRPDALEAMHPLAAWIPGWRRRVEELAKRYGYAIVGGSDAHVAASIGRARTVFPGESPADLVAAIRAHTTRPEGRRYSIGEVFRRYGAA